MCPPPCGSRRRSSRPSKSKITKDKVEDMISHGNIECWYKLYSEEEFSRYDGCNNNLLMILHDNDTSVKFADRRSSHFVNEKRTVIMDAPCFPAVLLIRSSE